MVVAQLWRELEPGSPEYFEQALRDINAVRAEYFDPPLMEIPKGYAMHGFDSCVLGNALGKHRAFDVVLGARESIFGREAIASRLNGPNAIIIEPTLLCDLENRFESGEFRSWSHKLTGTNPRPSSACITLRT